MMENSTLWKIISYLVFIALVVIFFAYLLLVYDKSNHKHIQFVAKGVAFRFNPDMCQSDKPIRAGLVGAPMQQTKPTDLDKKMVTLALENIPNRKKKYHSIYQASYGCVKTQVVAGIMYWVTIQLNQDQYRASIYQRPDGSDQVTVKSI